MLRKRALTAGLAGALLAAAVVAVVALAGDGEDPKGERAAAAAKVNRFDSGRAFAELERQVEIGPRPAGSPALRRLAERLRRELPHGRFERVPGHPGLRNVVGRLPGAKPPIAIAAHYDSKDIPDFVGANDGAAGTAAVLEIARALERAQRPDGAPALRFLLFDGEEATDDTRPFIATGLRGSKAYAKRHRGELRSLILLDFVAGKDMRIQREASSDLGPVGQAAARGESGRRGVRVPGGRRRRDHRRPHAVPRPGRPGDRPDRVAVPLLAQAVRRPVRRQRALARPDGGDRARARSYTQQTVTAAPEKLLLAAPRGYCAGVDRAVQTVERALELHGPPVYVRKEIVHNKHVVEELAARGAIFVDELSDEIPEGAVTVFSAHGVSPAVHADAAERGLRTIDATCPLVTKVHREAVKFAADGYTIVLVGHAGHEEVEGTMGEVPGSIVLVESEADVDALEIEDTEHIAFLTQTTLSVDETAAIIARLRERFPAITGPRTDDICYATTNRQLAVKQMAEQCDLVLVLGSKNSSNSNRLVDVARDCGADSHLIDNETEVREEWLEGARVVGISSGASAPEELVDPARRLLPCARHRGHLGVRGAARGRALHAAEGHPAQAASYELSQSRSSSPCSSRRGGGRRIGGRSPSSRSGGVGSG